MYYKLKQAYPGYEDKDVGKLTWFGPKNLVHPENYPDYWEKVVEKDYEILSFKWNYGSVLNPIYTLKDGLYCHDWNIPTTNKYKKEVLLNLPNYIIHSVKRLSDGEIFTIDDILNTKEFKHKYILEQILLRENTLFLIAQSDRNQTVSYGFGKELKDVFKAKLPLFTTEDGIDIFEGDKFYSYGTSKGIWENAKIQEYVAKIGTGQSHLGRYQEGNKLYWTTFSTKEKAEEYIFLNKPCLSLNDVASVYKSAFLSKNLHELIKSKIK